MATITGRDERPPSRIEATRERLARRRRNLLLPILLLVAVVLVAVAALLYWSADSVSQRNAMAQEDLIRSIVQIRKDNLRQLVIDYASWNEGITTRGTPVEARGAREEIPRYLRETFNISAGWIVAPDGTITFGFENGQAHSTETVPILPVETPSLLAAARGSGSISDVPPAGFVIYQQELALVAASPIATLASASASQDSASAVLVLVQPLDFTPVASAGLGERIDNLHFLRGAVPEDFLGCSIKGLDGQVIGSVVWRDQRPGDDLLWSVAPLLLVALAAVCFLAFLAIKRVETVVSREGRLSISLHQEKQRRSQKSEFVSMISHELRTPLQAIGTAADTLERFGDQMTAAERQEETRTIRRAVATLAGLVDDVLVIGRAEAGESRAAGEPADLGRLCRAVWREVSVALRSKQKLVLDDHIGAPIKGLNSAAVHTILSNLMQNAVKYSRGSGDVEVELRRDGPDIVITVTDCGPGIPAGEREAIFRPYWRSSQADGITGTGLGLPVARSAARSLGGDLVVEATGTDHGARFVVRWPASC